MRRLLALAAAIATTIVWIPSAQAGTITSNVADGILTVNGTTEGDDVTVRCEGGQVTVNHDHPTGGPDACADLRRILVFAGEGPDRVNLGDVTLNAFDHLTVTSVVGAGGGRRADRFGDRRRARGRRRRRLAAGRQGSRPPDPRTGRRRGDRRQGPRHRRGRGRRRLEDQRCASAARAGRRGHDARLDRDRGRDGRSGSQPDLGRLVHREPAAQGAGRRRPPAGRAQATTGSSAARGTISCRRVPATTSSKAAWATTR